MLTAATKTTRFLIRENTDSNYPFWRLKVDVFMDLPGRTLPTFS
jgi:hypothetical protein